LAMLNLPAPAAGQTAGGPRFFVSVDMEGIGGVGSPAMTSAEGKDYGTARELMTRELNAVISALFDAGAGYVLVNDSHGDHQNVLHTELDPRAEYVQGSIKRMGMVAELDGTYQGALYIGYHAMAGVPDAFLAHTGSGAVKGLWVNGIEVGEAGMNALYAGSVGVPVILASGDQAFAEEFTALTGAPTVVTKTALGSSAARLRDPASVREDLRAATTRAVAALSGARPLAVREPVTVRIRFQTTTQPYILEAIPGVRRVDGYTVEFAAETMTEAYQLIRLAYRFVSW
ncbi:MAG TPA: M55 family metallopeptidase, partial [Longimicrobiales bacterium]|nr:M55 family metallopeptidase [Longimicrobiales bacterium]